MVVVGQLVSGGMVVGVGNEQFVGLEEVWFFVVQWDVDCIEYCLVEVVVGGQVMYYQLDVVDQVVMVQFYCFYMNFIEKGDGGD